MKVIYLAFLFFFPLINYGQEMDLAEYSKSDSAKIKLAKDFLIKRFGEQFLHDTLEFKGIYESTLDMVAFEIKKEISPDTNRNMILIFLDGDKVETQFNTKISRQDLTGYFKGTSTSNIFLNKDYALNKAKSEGLEKGIKDDWEVSISGVADSIWWVIGSVDKEEYDPVYSASGKELKVNIRNGKTKLGTWVEVE